MNVKTMISGIVLAGAVAIGGILGYGIINDEAEGVIKPEEMHATTSATGDEDPNVKHPTPEAPTERTAPGLTDCYPWTCMSRETIATHQSEGKVVHLFDDGGMIIDKIVGFSTMEYEEKAPVSQSEQASLWADHLNLYLAEMEQYYPDKMDYFVKLREISAALKSTNLDVVPGLAEEAAALR